jgi:hypothetical protein
MANFASGMKGPRGLHVAGLGEQQFGGLADQGGRAPAERWVWDDEHEASAGIGLEGEIGGEQNQVAQALPAVQQRPPQRAGTVAAGRRRGDRADVRHVRASPLSIAAPAVGSMRGELTKPFQARTMRRIVPTPGGIGGEVGDTRHRCRNRTDRNERGASRVDRIWGSAHGPGARPGKD